MPRRAAALTRTQTNLEVVLTERRRAMRAKFDELERLGNGQAPSGRARERWGFLAATLGVSPHAVSYWVRRGYVPRAMALAIERTYGRAKVKAESLGQVLIGDSTDARRDSN